MNRLIGLMLALCVATPAWAQQRPLQTEDPETIGAGRLMLEAGIDYERDVWYPLSGLHGNLLTIPPFGVSVGVSSIAEIQLDWGIHQSLSITEQTPHEPADLRRVDGTALCGGCSRGLLSGRADEKEPARHVDDDRRAAW